MLNQKRQLELLDLGAEPSARELDEIKENMKQGLRTSRDREEVRYPNHGGYATNVWIDDEIHEVIQTIVMHYATTESQAARYLLRLGAEEARHIVWAEPTVGALTHNVGVCYDKDIMWRLTHDMKGMMRSKAAMTRRMMKLGIRKLRWMQSPIMVDADNRLRNK